MKFSIPLFIACLATSLYCTSQDVELVKEFNSGLQLVSDTSTITFEAELNNKILFTKYSWITGRELWVTDGSTSGTFLIKDVYAGELSSNPRDFHSIVDGFIFTASTELGDELWFTDGTSENTRLVKDIRLGRNSSVIKTYSLGSKVLVVVPNESGSNNKYWLTDGTAEGTSSAWEPSFQVFESDRDNYTYNDQLIMVQRETIYNNLYSSDGTSQGSFRLFPQNAPLSGAYEFLELNGILYFLGSQHGIGYTIFRTDGSPEGSTTLINMEEEIFHFPREMIEYNNQIIFTASSPGPTIWRTDGSNEGTYPLSSQFNWDYSSSLFNLKVAGDCLFFLKNTQFGNPNKHLYCLNGTQIQQIEGIGVEYDDLESMVSQNGDLYLSGLIPDIGYELCHVDGETMELTSYDLNFGIDHSYPSDMHYAGNTLFFTALYNGERVVWKMISGGYYPEILTDEDGMPLIAPEGISFETIGDQVLFEAQSPDLNHQLWVSDGSDNGTFPITNFNIKPRSGVSNLMSYNQHLYFSAHDENLSHQLFISDGTTSGTSRYSSINNEENYEIKSPILKTNHQLFFLGGQTDESRPYLISPDSMAPSPAAVYIDLDSPRRAIDMTALNDQVFYSYDTNVENPFGPSFIMSTNGIETDLHAPLSDPLKFTISFSHGPQVWLQTSRDGTNGDNGLYFMNTENNDLIHTSQHGSYPESAHSKIFAPINDGVIYTPEVFSGREPHFANENEFFQLADINPSGSADILNFEFLNGLYYFIAFDGKGDEVWQTDGTIEGTEMSFDLNNLQPGAFSPNYEHDKSQTSIGKKGNKLLFAGQQDNLDFELFISDGTAEGTEMLANINRYESSYPHNFWEGENYTYFTADDGVHGFELFRTDGTQEGTELVADIAQGAQSSMPENFHELEGYLYCTAFVDGLGRELIRIPQKCIDIEASAYPLSMCQGETLNIESDLSENNNEIQAFGWDLGNGDIIQDLSLSTVYPEHGFYTILGSFTTTDGCTHSQQFDIRIYPYPLGMNDIPDLDLDLCLGTSLEISADSLFDDINTQYSWKINDLEVSHSPSFQHVFYQPGNNVLTLESSNGSCEIFELNNINVYSVDLEIIDLQSRLCPGDPYGILESIAYSPFEPISYSTHNFYNQEQGIFTDLPLGEGTLIAEDSMGCTTEENYVVVDLEASLLTLSSTPDDGTSNGTITATVNGGNPPFLYALNGGVPTENNFFTGLTSGNHLVSIADGFGCVLNQTIEVEINSNVNELNELDFRVAPTISSGAFTLNIPTGRLGQIHIYDTKGSLVYQSSTDQSNIELDLTFLASGIYQLIVGDHHKLHKKIGVVH